MPSAILIITRQVLPRWQDFPHKDPRLFGNPQIRPPGLWNPPSTTPSNFPSPDIHYTRLRRKGGYPQTRGKLSLLPRIFRRHQHPPLGCQPWSPECSTHVRKSLCDLARLFRTPQASLPDSTPLICVLIARHTPHSENYLRRSCAPSDDISLGQLCSQQCVRTNMRIYTQNTPNSARSHYNINSGIHINLITINNASLSHNSTHVHLLQERTLSNPDFPCHHTRPPPVKAAISHGDSRDSQSDIESLPTNCFVHNIESPSPTNIRCIPSHVYDHYISIHKFAIVIFVHLKKVYWQGTCNLLEISYHFQFSVYVVVYVIGTNENCSVICK